MNNLILIRTNCEKDESNMQTYGGIICDMDTYLGNEDLSKPLFINSCGYFKIDEINTSLNRCRKDFYLIYLINGVGHYKLGQHFVAVDAGNIIIFKPGEKQEYYYLAEEKAEAYWIHFTGYEAENLLNSLSLSNRNVYKTGVDSECISIFESIIHEIQIRKPYFHQLCIGHLIQLMSSFSRKAVFLERGKGVFKNREIENVIKVMHENYQQQHEIDYYAKICNLSVYQFIRNFKKATNLSPAKYIEKIRINKAKELLVDTNLTVNEISGLVGYSDAFYFSKVFKKATNFAPTAFRASVKRKIEEMLD